MVKEPKMFNCIKDTKYLSIFKLVFDSTFV